MDIKAKIPQNMNKNACMSILVRDIRRIDHIKIEITQLDFKIFAWNFGNRLQIAFPPYCEADFWLNPPKKFGGQILNYAGQILEFGRQILLEAFIKNRLPQLKAEMRFEVDSQHFMQKL